MKITFLALLVTTAVMAANAGRITSDGNAVQDIAIATLRTCVQYSPSQHSASDFELALTFIWLPKILNAH